MAGMGKMGCGVNELYKYFIGYYYLVIVRIGFICRHNPSTLTSLFFAARQMFVKYDCRPDNCVLSEFWFLFGIESR